MSLHILCVRTILILHLLFLVSEQVNAQVKPDLTLGAERSTISPNQTVKGVPSDVISGGAVRGTNLFHSFQEFNVNLGRGVYFTNPFGIINIFTRVTGNNPSNISGILGVLGNANLFLLNPNGIVFGPNARLQLNGSFLATTANNIKFSDGIVFSATKSQSAPLLTISVPIGLQFEGNTGSIRVEGVGHNLITPPSLVAPIIDLGSILPGLKTQPGHTLALIGGDVTFTGGIATAPSGRIEIGSVISGQVSITPNSLEGFSLGYEGVKNSQDILFEKQSLINASGVTGGDIQVFGRNVKLTDSSLAFIENQGPNRLGTIRVNALNSLTINGNTNFSRFLPNLITNPITIPNGLISQALLNGQGADISISTKNFTIQDSGQITLSTFGSGRGGDLNLTASDSARILGKSPFTPLYPFSSIVQTLSATEGNSGNIVLTAKHLSVQDGGELITTVFGNAIAGDVSVNTASIDLTGFNSVSLIPSVVSSTNLNAGHGGNVFINTDRLLLKNGGSISTSTLASGSAGDIFIKATDFIDISGIVPNSVNSSSIISSAYSVDINNKAILGVPIVPTGASGNTIIDTSRLSVTNGAQVSVRNDGIGNAGRLQINANYINLNQGDITASTASGVGGNIFLHLTNQLNLNHNSIISATAGGQGTGGNITIDPQQTIISNGSGIAVNSTGTGNAGQLKLSSNNLILNNGSFLSANTNGGEGGNISLNTQTLQLRHNSLLTASAAGTGNGGNITIKSPLIVALPSENSDIIANAIKGRGGNIDITTQGIFGIQPRLHLTPLSDITASSNLGVNGTVQINTFPIDPTLGLAVLPVVPLDVTGLIAQGCPATVGPRASKFVVTGRGGLPLNTGEARVSDATLQDTRNPTATTANQRQRDRIAAKKAFSEAPPIVPATGWVFDGKGKVTLVASVPTARHENPWLTSTTCQDH